MQAQTRAIIENWNNFTSCRRKPEFDGMEDGIVVENEKGLLSDIVATIVPRFANLSVDGQSLKRRKVPFLSFG